MTFSFDENLADDKSLVRDHIGDTEEAGAYLSDERINAYIASEGSVGGAVIKGIRYIITQLAKPDAKQDWNSISYGAARKGWEDILKRKSIELGISLGSLPASTISQPYRADSDQYSNVTRTETDRDNTSIYDGS